MAVLFYRAAKTCMLLVPVLSRWIPLMAMILLRLGLEMLLTSVCLLRTVSRAIAQ